MHRHPSSKRRRIRAPQSTDHSATTVTRVNKRKHSGEDTKGEGGGGSGGDGGNKRYKIRNISKVETDLKQPSGADAGILPKHPFRWYVVGGSGSGKSNMVVNLLTSKDMYKDYFDSVIIISPTALHLDPTYKELRLKKSNFFPPEEEVLERIMEIQEEKVEDFGKSGAPKILIVLDDFISYKRFANSSILLKFAVMSRHWNISMIVISQAYHRVPKSIRLQMSAVSYFKGSNKEQKVLAEDFGAPGLSDREFICMIDRATSEPFCFFFIDLHRAISENRYRKNLDEAA